MDVNKETVLFLSKLLFASLSHPSEHAKVLTQLGQSPPSRKILFLRIKTRHPTTTECLKHILDPDGYFSCYRGLPARLLGIITSRLCTIPLLKACGIDWPELDNPPNISETEPILEDYFKIWRRDVTLSVTSAIISYPFSLIAIRMIASFIGGEDQYSTLMQSVESVYEEDGVIGFFYGLVPKLVALIINASLRTCLAYIVNKHLVKTEYLRYYTFQIISVLSRSVTYPLMLVSTCMAVNGSSLSVGNPPMMPWYSSWVECLADLFNKDEHNRGASLPSILIRMYLLPS